jgi:hypothetical protein
MSGCLAEAHWRLTASRLIELNISAMPSRDSRTGDIEKVLGMTETSSSGRPTASRNGTAESPSSPLHHTSIELHGALDWVFVAGVLSSLVGYVACFSVIQKAKSRSGPLTWLCVCACMHNLALTGSRSRTNERAFKGGR